MSALATTVLGSTTSIKITNTSATLRKDDVLQKKAAEVEAKRVANVATQKKKRAAAEKKLTEQLPSRGKNSILKDQPSRPAHRPVKKNRKPLPPLTNKEHDIRTVTVETKADMEEKEYLAALSIPRPSLNFDRFIEQRVVNGVVECIPESTGAPQAAGSAVDTDSDSAANSDNDTNGESHELTSRSSTHQQDAGSSGGCAGSVGSVRATALSHVYDDVPMIDAEDGHVTSLFKMANGPGITEESRDLHEKLIVMHVAPLLVPVTAPKQQKTPKSKRKDAKANQRTPVSGKTEGPSFFASLLAKSEGSGENKEARDLHNDLAEMHVARFELPPSPQPQKEIKKAESADTLVSIPIYEPATFDASKADENSVVPDDRTSAVADANADEFTHDEETLIEDVAELGPLPFIKAKDNLQQVDVRVVETIDKQTVVIPDDTTPVTPPISDPDLSSSGSDYPKSTKSSRRFSVESSVDSVRRKAEKARITFLGETSLETFVNTLDFELCDGTTTKDDVSEAFAFLAGRSPHLFGICKDSAQDQAWRHFTLQLPSSTQL
ncbi:hypothetical protein G6011_10242 [Alternaria panax]|uniref:Uncharacterized protein n=1 Tax=Alternaria panax TaxID=48097 RepID=A0AAD4IB94_9PLEO|nr:hypothetical protein G6011_10242 [Alternaria panax]